MSYQARLQRCRFQKRGSPLTYIDTMGVCSNTFDTTGDDILPTTSVFRHFAVLSSQPPLSELPDASEGASPAGYFSQHLSRVIDIAGALVLLVAAFPFLVLLAIALQLDSPGRLFFVQQRVGYRGRLFPCLKFRTMCEDSEVALAHHLALSEAARTEWTTTFKLQDDPRVTSLGRIVRKLSLDEFPQLLNILRGEMSLVGPRPIVEKEIRLYGRYFADYCRVRPGLTGLWQISGRNDTSYRRRVCIDTVYVRRKSVALDLAILVKTVPAVVTARGSY
jgi:exopolysaccharide production protein ExoY